MQAPAWGDSVHHTVIVQLLLDNERLFESWAPYAPIESFTYHFGFHVNAAVWARFLGSDALHAALTASQILNGLAVLMLFSLAVRLSSSRWMGMAVP